MAVSVFERNYLEDVLREDVRQKQQIFQASRPVIEYVFGDSLKWDAIPFPKVAGTILGHGSNATSWRAKEFVENAAILEGRSAPHGLEDIPIEAAIYVREHKTVAPRAISVSICFNSFPTFHIHPLTGPLPSGGVWMRSFGNWHVEQEAQQCNAVLAEKMFPSNNGKMEVSTVSNAVIPGMDGYAHKSMKVYEWETEQKYTLQVLHNNTIVIIQRDRLTID